MPRTRFCAECGKQNVPLHDNFCQDCYWHFNQLATLKKTRVELAYCLECGSVKLKSGWTGPNYKEEIPEIIAYAHFNNISAPPTVIIDVAEISEIHWINPNPEFIISYSVISDQILEFEPHEEIKEMEVKIQGGTCTTCIKRKTGSGDVTVQFRAKNRQISKEEMDTATTLAFTHSADMSYESQEAYISDIIESYGGLDFYFGNDAVAEAFIDSIKKQWIGHYEKNYKLVTEDKDERKIYAVTHLFRLPEVQIGDIIEWEDELHIVKYISKSGIHLQSLVDRSRSITKDWEDLKPLDPPPKLENKLIVSEDVQADSYLVMDMTSYNTFEIQRSRFPRSLEISGEETFLVWKDKLYLEPPADHNVEGA